MAHVRHKHKYKDMLTYKDTRKYGTRMAHVRHEYGTSVTLRAGVLVCLNTVVAFAIDSFNKVIQEERQSKKVSAVHIIPNTGVALQLQRAVE